MTKTFYIKREKDGRYLGEGIWTFNRSKAQEFSESEAALLSMKFPVKLIEKGPTSIYKALMRLANDSDLCILVQYQNRFETMMTPRQAMDMIQKSINQN